MIVDIFDAPLDSWGLWRILHHTVQYTINRYTNVERCFYCYFPSSMFGSDKDRKIFSDRRQLRYLDCIYWKRKKGIDFTIKSTQIYYYEY